VPLPGEAARHSQLVGSHIYMPWTQVKSTWSEICFLVSVKVVLGGEGGVILELKPHIMKQCKGVTHMNLPTNAFLKTTVCNNVFCARFYCVLLTTCFGPNLWPSAGKMYTKYILG
jgi:hypothetical protein